MEFVNKTSIEHCSFLSNDNANVIFVLLLTFALFVPYGVAPWGNGSIFYDAIIYMECGEWQNQGMAMYRDMFDNKGPLWYFYQGFHESVFGEMGAWVCDMVMTMITMLFVYATSRVFLSSKQSLLVVILSILYINIFFINSGSFPQVFTMPFVAISVYMFVKRLFRNEVFSLLEVFMLGVMFAIVFLTMANNVAPFIAFFFYCVIILAKTRQWKRLSFSLLLALLGIAFVFIPLLLSMYKKGNLHDFYEMYIVFNLFGYSADTTIVQRLLLMAKISVVAFPMYILWLVYIINTSNRKYCVWISVLFAVTCAFDFLLLGNAHRHFLITCIPVFSLMIALTYNHIKKKKLLAVSLFAAVALMSFYTIYKRSVNSFSNVDKSHTMAVANYINAHTNEGDFFYTYMVDQSVWRYVHCKPASRFFYQDGVMNYVKSFVDETEKDILEKKPTYIYCSSKDNDRFIKMGYTRCSDCEFANILILKDALDNENLD